MLYLDCTYVRTSNISGFSAKHTHTAATALLTTDIVKVNINDPVKKPREESMEVFTTDTPTLFAYANASSIVMTPPSVLPKSKMQSIILSERRVENPLSVNITTTALRRERERERECVRKRDE